MECEACSVNSAVLKANEATINQARLSLATADSRVVLSSDQMRPSIVLSYCHRFRKDTTDTGMLSYIVHYYINDT